MLNRDGQCLDKFIKSNVTNEDKSVETVLGQQYL